MSEISPFVVKSCALAAIATGEQAISAIGLRDKIATVPIDCIYYHFWGGRLFSQYAHPEYHNDFAVWAHTGLKDETLAERLSILDPTEYSCLENLRTDILEVLENRLDEYTMITLAKKEDLFHFIRSKIIVFDTPYIIEKPEDIPKILTELSPSSFFYHFIDARSRTKEKCDDFSTWLATFGPTYSQLIEKLKAVDIYFLSLSSLRDEVIDVVRDYFGLKEKEKNVRTS